MDAQRRNLFQILYRLALKFLWAIEFSEFLGFATHKFLHVLPIFLEVQKYGVLVFHLHKMALFLPEGGQFDGVQSFFECLGSKLAPFLHVHKLKVAFSPDELFLDIMSGHTVPELPFKLLKREP